MTLPEKLLALEDPGKCILCRSPDRVRRYGVCVDGEPLRVQLPLCQDHGDEYLIRVGNLVGEMLREHRP